MRMTNDDDCVSLVSDDDANCCRRRHRVKRSVTGFNPGIKYQILELYIKTSRRRGCFVFIRPHFMRFHDAAFA
jgi:hypothetical protein